MLRSEGARPPRAPCRQSAKTIDKPGFRSTDGRVKSTLAPLCALAALFVSPLSAFQPGDAVTPDSLLKAEKIQGDIPAKWEPGKVYVIECWATWCGPCVAAIPHVDALYDKYQEKGLRVIGMNVWEDGKEKVAEFVKKKGDGMSYPVAYVGKGGEFEGTWLRSSGVRGIPHAFVLKDGKLLFSTHPAQLDEKTIDLLLSGPEGVDKAQKAMTEAQAAQGKLASAMQKFSHAVQKKDVAAMEAAVEELKGTPAAERMLPRMRLQISLVKKDWAGLTTLLAAEKDTPGYAVMAATVAGEATREGSGAPQELLQSLATGLEPVAAQSPFFYNVLARLQWATGQKDEAKQSAAKMTAALEKAAQEGKIAPIATSRKFSESLEKGEIMSHEEFDNDMRQEAKEMMDAKRAAAAKEQAAKPESKEKPAGE